MTLTSGSLWKRVQTVQCLLFLFLVLPFLCCIFYFTMRLLESCKGGLGAGADFCAMPDMNTLGFEGTKVTGGGSWEGLLRFALPWIAGATLSLCHIFVRQGGDPDRGLAVRGGAFTQAADEQRGQRASAPGRVPSLSLQDWLADSRLDIGHTLAH